ncbi:hypothetical protein IAQ61_001537, partial [Plenodomus lingam]
SDTCSSTITVTLKRATVPKEANAHVRTQRVSLSARLAPSVASLEGTSLASFFEAKSSARLARDSSRGGRGNQKDGYDDRQPEFQSNGKANGTPTKYLASGALPFPGHTVTVHRTRGSRVVDESLAEEWIG